MGRSSRSVFNWRLSLKTESVGKSVGCSGMKALCSIRYVSPRLYLQGSGRSRFQRRNSRFQSSVQSLNLVRPPVLLSPLAGVSLWKTCRDVRSVVGGKAGFCVLPCAKIQKPAGFLRYYVENMWAKVCRFQKLLYFCTAFERKRHDMRK